MAHPSSSRKSISCHECALSAKVCVIGAALVRLPSALRPTTHLVFLRRGECVMPAGTQARSLDVIKTGLATVGQVTAAGTEVPMAMVGRGHVIGVRGLTSHPSMFWARAQTDLTLCRIPHDQIQDQVAELVCQMLPDLYAIHLEVLTRWTQLVRVPNVKDRVMAALALLGEIQAPQTRYQLPRQAEMAALLNTTRESLGRILGDLERDGYLLRSGRQLIELVRGSA